MLLSVVEPGNKVSAWGALEVEGIQRDESETDNGSAGSQSGESSMILGDGEFVGPVVEVVVEEGAERRSRLAAREAAGSSG